MKGECPPPLSFPCFPLLFSPPPPPPLSLFLLFFCFGRERKKRSFLLFELSFCFVLRGGRGKRGRAVERKERLICLFFC